MPCVTKCCCCCSLKYGYFAYGIICLVFRICAITTMLLTATTIGGVHHYNPRLGMAIGGYSGWFICSAVALFIALKGIVQRRSILLYPYIVVLIFEIICMAIVTIIEIFMVSPWMLIKLVIIGVVDIYAAICLTSLYQHMKEIEKSRPMLMDSVPFKHVV